MADRKTVTPPLIGTLYIDTADPETARREMSKILAPHAMNASGDVSKFRARHHHARLGMLSVNYIQYQPAATISAGASRRFYLIHHVLQGRCDVHRRHSVDRAGTGDLTVINPFETLHLEISEDCAQIVIKLDREFLVRILADRFDIDLDRSPIFTGISNAADEAAAAVIDTIELLCREASRIARGNGSPRAEQTLEELFAVTLIERLPHDLSERLHQRQNMNRIAPWYIKRVEEFIDLHADSQISIADMIAVVGISERALFKGFRTWRGITPKAHLKAVRLDRVRTELLGKDAKHRTVAEVAKSWGFQHLGNFARDYKKRFGEKPSETLRFHLTDRPASDNFADKR